eukprot:scaffold143_cov260-Pinguiococcus_pyrenoidosus.AAC.53
MRVAQCIPLAFGLLFLALYRQERRNNACGMTWSYPVYLEIPLPEDVRTLSAFRVYRFSNVEDRDVARRNMAESPARDQPLFRYKGRILVFLPGHLGEFTQVRSLGSEVFNAAGGDPRLDIYTFDFDVQASAFHARALELQAEYVCNVLLHLGDMYGAKIDVSTSSSADSVHPSETVAGLSVAAAVQ